MRHNEEKTSIRETLQHLVIKQAKVSRHFIKLLY